jgi:hypothetical protein
MLRVSLQAGLKTTMCHRLALNMRSQAMTPRLYRQLLEVAIYVSPVCLIGDNFGGCGGNLAERRHYSWNFVVLMFGDEIGVVAWSVATATDFFSYIFYQNVDTCEPWFVIITIMCAPLWIWVCDVMGSTYTNVDTTSPSYASLSQTFLSDAPCRDRAARDQYHTNT